MMNPLKLFLLTLGTALLLAVAPYCLSRLVPERILATTHRPQGVAVTRTAAPKAPPPEGHASPGPQVPEAKLTRPEKVARGGMEGVPAGAEGSFFNAPRQERTTLATPTPAPAPTPIPYRPEVARAQEMLGKLGFDAGKADGKFGQRTESALRAFEKKYALPAGQDVTPDLLARMEKEIAALAPPPPTPAPSPAAKATVTPVAVLVEDVPKVDVTIAAAAAAAPVVREVESASKPKTTAPALTPSPTPVPTPAPAPSPTPAVQTAAADPQFVVLTAEGEVDVPAPADNPQEPAAEKKPLQPPASAEPIPDLDPGRVPTLRSMKDVKLIQHALVAVGSYPEEPDGKWGNKTIVAMREFQRIHELKITGKPNTETWKKLVEEAARAKEKAQEAEASEAVAEETPPLPERLLADLPAATEEKTAASAGAVAVNQLLQAAPKPKAAGIVPGPSGLEVPEEKLTRVQGGGNASAAAAPSAPLPQFTPGTLEVSRPADAPPPVEEKSEPAKPTQDSPAPPVAPPDPFAPAARAEQPPPAPSTDTVAEKAAVEAVGAVLESDSETPSLSGEPVAASSTPAVQDPLPTPAEVSRQAVESVANTPAMDAALEAISEAEKLPAPAMTSPASPGSGSSSAPAGLAPAALRSTPPAVAVTVPSTRVSPPASKAEVQEAERLRELEGRIGEIRSAVEAAEKDERLELAKYAPAKIASARSLLAEAETAVKSAGSRKTQEALTKAQEELENARNASLKAKAEAKVQEVESAYKALKARFSSQIRSNSELADTMTKIDGGFEAMMADFKKGNYPPIVDRCDGFRLSIEQLSEQAAKEYLEEQLKKDSVKKRLSRTELKELADLQEKSKYLEAVELLEKQTAEEKKKTSQKEKSGSSSSKRSSRRG